ncbi:MAG: sulfite exporter TauE/SafE family protein [Gammaproteobacteria bacterium]|nr:sulfite exporter TauE/SafE family protein [Gammaproteobacteria bacterium]MDH4254796.1 sulfite exporter TauE/SafE family protein [Gammaproteobacteria bacterium]MDH5310792.1 sulfite exporter TauE/SafE family protein [Gammaproteobacteria bacterium]
MISDPVFYLFAVPAVLIFGISKGGFGGGLGIVAVPMLALVISPVQAAAILLPILCLMDLFSVWAFRGRWLFDEIRLLVPASLVGIGIGAALFEYMSPAIVRLLLGVVTIVFTLHYWIGNRFGTAASRPHFGPLAGGIAGATAGFTSFIAHSGGPPLNMYLLRRGLNRTEFVGTTVLFFTAVNYVKLVPYAWLGQFDSANLATSAILAPLAPAGIGIGVWLHHRVSETVFFRVIYVLLFAVGVKLVNDGLTGL